MSSNTPFKQAGYSGNYRSNNNGNNPYPNFINSSRILGQTNATGSLGNSMSNYFSKVNSTNNATPQHPATIPGPSSFKNTINANNNMRTARTLNNSSGGFVAAKAAQSPLARAGGGGLGAVQAASEVASGLTTGVSNSYNIQGNAYVTNNWYDNIHGNAGVFNGLGNYSGQIASAESRAYDRVSNFTSTGKAIGGPIGQLAGFLLGKASSKVALQKDLESIDFKTLSTTDQGKIDPRDASTSTASSANGHATTDNKEAAKQTGMHNQSSTSAGSEVKVQNPDEGRDNEQDQVVPDANDSNSVVPK